MVAIGSQPEEFVVDLPKPRQKASNTPKIIEFSTNFIVNPKLEKYLTKGKNRETLENIVALDQVRHEMANYLKEISPYDEGLVERILWNEILMDEPVFAANEAFRRPQMQKSWTKIAELKALLQNIEAKDPRKRSDDEEIIISNPNYIDEVLAYEGLDKINNLTHAEILAIAEQYDFCEMHVNFMVRSEALPNIDVNVLSRLLIELIKENRGKQNFRGEVVSKEKILTNLAITYYLTRSKILKQAIETAIEYVETNKSDSGVEG